LRHADSAAGACRHYDSSVEELEGKEGEGSEDERGNGRPGRPIGDDGVELEDPS
jgi:hypothetical protein